MVILDSDIFSLVSYESERVARRLASCQDQVAITIITRLEVLTGRAASILKAADSTQLRQAQARLQTSEAELAEFQLVWLDERAFELFERFRKNKSLTRKMGLKDLLIASIALAHDATLVTRNTKDFVNIPPQELPGPMTWEVLKFSSSIYLNRRTFHAAAQCFLAGTGLSCQRNG